MYKFWALQWNQVFAILSIKWPQDQKMFMFAEIFHQGNEWRPIALSHFKFSEAQKHHQFVKEWENQQDTDHKTS